VIAVAANSKWVATSTVEVAEFFGVSDTVVRKDWKARGMPGERGCYDLSEIARWKIERERNLNQPKELDDERLAERLELAEVLSAEADAGMKQLKLAEAEGRMMDRDQVVAEIMEAFNIVRARIEQIPGEVVATLPPELRPDAHTDWKHKVHLALKVLESQADAYA
jgi:hypothetical protein